MFHSCTVPPSLYHFVWNIATPSEIIAPPSKIIAHLPRPFTPQLCQVRFSYLTIQTYGVRLYVPWFCQIESCQSLNFSSVYSFHLNKHAVLISSFSLSFIWSTFLSHFLTMPLLSHFVIMRSVHVYFSDFPKLKVVQLGWICRHSWFFCYQYYSGQVRDS